MSSGGHGRPLMAVGGQRTEVLEPGGRMGNSKIIVFAELLLGDGHWEVEEGHGFILLIFLLLGLLS